MAEMQSQPVEYLAVSEALLNDPTVEEKIIILTIGPDPPNWFSVNLALSTAQAGRLLADLQNLLIPFGLLVAVLLAATVGCSAEVEVGRTDWSSPASARQTRGKSRSTPASTSDVAINRQGSLSFNRRRTSSRIIRRCAAY